MSTNKKPKPSKRTQTCEDILRSRLAELRAHVDQLRKDMMVEDEVDDEAMQASQSRNRELATITMEREIRNISEIEQALKRIANDEYGVCVTCEKQIPDNRLKAIPWTRQCVECAGGGIKRTGRAFGQPAYGSSLIS